MYSNDVSNRTNAPSYQQNNPIDNQASPGDSILGKDDFLRLLTTQLRYQDPMNPVDDQQFLAQMAQFTALEQMQNLTVTMERFVEQEHYNKLFADATGLLGKSVEVVGASGESYIGTVDAVRIVDGVPRLVVNDTLFHVRDVLKVTNKPA